MMKDNADRGFSLIELLIALSILMILSSMLYLGVSSARRKETGKYVTTLSSQIRLSQTTSMSQTGQWRLALYRKDKEYYCVHERKRAETENAAPDSDGEAAWEQQSEKFMLGYAGAVNYEPASSPIAEADGETPIYVWRFDRDTGSCIEGTGTVTVTGADKTRYITVYEENGRCEVREAQ